MAQASYPQNSELPANQQPLYPIPREVFYGITDLFGLLDEHELHAVENGNVGLLEADHPLHYLLSGQARSDLIAENPTDHQRASLAAYRMGVCLGTVIMRSHKKTLRAQGYDIPDLSLAPGETPVFEAAGLRFAKISRLMLSKKKRANRQEQHELRRPARYLAHESDIVALGILKNRLIEHSFTFMNENHLKEHVPMYISMGVGDVFELYENLYKSRDLPTSQLRNLPVNLGNPRKRHSNTSQK